jgi:rare lipoprotein A
MTAAHRTLPLPSYVRVRNRDNGKTVVVRVNDRGPFLRNRIIDLSYAAAHRLGIVGHGTGAVEVEAIIPGDAQTPSVAVPAPVTESAVRPVLSQVFIQVGAFSDPTNAQALRNRLIGAGFHPVAVDSAATGTPRLYRVRVGPLVSVLEADRELVRLNGTFADAPRIIIE